MAKPQPRPFWRVSIQALSDARPAASSPVCPAARSVRPSTPCLAYVFPFLGPRLPAHQVSSGGCPSFRPASPSGKLLGEQPSWGPPALGSDCLPAGLGPSPSRLSVPWPGRDPWAAELTARLTGGGAGRWHEPRCLLCPSPMGPGDINWHLWVPGRFCTSGPWDCSGTLVPFPPTDPELLVTPGCVCRWGAEARTGQGRGRCHSSLGFRPVHDFPL